MGLSNSDGTMITVAVPIPTRATNVSISIVNSSLILRKEGGEGSRTISNASYNSANKCVELTMNSTVASMFVFGLAGNAALKLTFAY